jgi:hypothetical protein
VDSIGDNGYAVDIEPSYEFEDREEQVKPKGEPEVSAGMVVLV